MDIPIQVCAAGPADAGIISRIIERSIRTGCAIDHRNDPATVQAWMRNQTVDDIQRWATDSELHLRLGLLHGKPVAVGLAMPDGQIRMCYVQPECFRRGVGRAVMNDLESCLAQQGCCRASLYSTATGLAFYRHLGYRSTGGAIRFAGLSLIPMFKRL
ncbi:N-acetyltransferase [Pseudomonas sp. R5(2019)]|uniref:GNAT family N-acetyltransferase n=1 Tax=Pseudomonas sp. R5(2019) TaxID=2697566 RepID=UPI001411BB59|nr:GNAT family N-acetyltransferase [Pseudomonas sp. R5(2019)]NBA96234.1 GNAT family N-acetyltransferase [Pseudomonas sp. R5(2019)]